jgi:beta-lactamase regulating signal transducer with metallopeptidase domain
MMSPVAFLLLAGIFMLIGQHYLRTAAWARRAPRLGIALWQALTGATVICLLLACVTLTLPGMSAAATLGEAVRACAHELKHQYSTPGGALVTTAGISALAILATRLTRALWSNKRRAQLARQKHLDTLELLARPDSDGTILLDHRSAAVYCVPDSRLGRRPGAVVMTTGARQALTRKQLHLVLRHERAHLRSRHDRLVLRSRSLAEALPWLPFFRIAHDQIAELVELHADDAVAFRDRPDLAHALYRLAGGEPIDQPAGALSATGSSAAVRVARLIRPHAPLPTRSAMLVITAIAVIAAAPATLAAYPAGTGISHHCCAALGQTTTPTGSTPSPQDLLSAGALPRD